MAHLAQEIFENAGKSKELTYNGLADIVQKSDSMEFLQGIYLEKFCNVSFFDYLFLEMVPRKITVKEYQEILKDKENSDLF